MWDIQQFPPSVVADEGRLQKNPAQAGRSQGLPVVAKDNPAREGHRQDFGIVVGEASGHREVEVLDLVVTELRLEGPQHVAARQIVELGPVKEEGLRQIGVPGECNDDGVKVDLQQGRDGVCKNKINSHDIVS